MPKAIIIGAGFGGIAASLRLRKKGYDVEIIDRCLSIGGRAQVYESKGFKFDAGPTVLTATFLFDDLFTLIGTIFRGLPHIISIIDLISSKCYRYSNSITFDFGSRN